jgi:hypothetical protein
MSTGLLFAKGDRVLVTVADDVSVSLGLSLVDRPARVVEVHDYSSAPETWDVAGPDRALYDVELDPPDEWTPPSRHGVPLTCLELRHQDAPAPSLVATDP